jgi:hypothetical protein
MNIKIDKESNRSIILENPKQQKNQLLKTSAAQANP